MGHPTLRTGPDKQVTLMEDSEEHACRARCIEIDNSTRRGGRDKRVPPKVDLTNGSVERAPPFPGPLHSQIPTICY